MARLHGDILRRTSRRQAEVARALGKDPATLSRVLSGEIGIRLPDLESFLLAIGLKAVDADAHVLDDVEYRFLRHAGRKVLTDEEEPPTTVGCHVEFLSVD